MKVSSPIATHILEFVAKNLDSIPELEALLLLSESQGREWTEDELAARIYVSPQAARAVVEALHRRGLVALAPDASTFRFGAVTSTEASIVKELAIEYRKHLIPLTMFLHSKGTAAVKEFARAFDIKRDK